MPEPTSRSKAMRVGAPMTVGTVTLVPIERIVIDSDRGDAGLWFSAAKLPHALIVHDADGIRSVDIGSGAFSLEELLEQIAGLAAVLARYRR